MTPPRQPTNTASTGQHWSEVTVDACRFVSALLRAAADDLDAHPDDPFTLTCSEKAGRHAWHTLENARQVLEGHELEPGYQICADAMETLTEAVRIGIDMAVDEQNKLTEEGV